MTALFELSLKTSLIVATGLLATAVLRRRSAAVRHWMLATTMLCAGAVPVLAVIIPSWTIATIGRPAQASAPGADISVSTTPVRDGRPAPSAADVASHPPALLARASDLVVPLWIAGVVLNLSVLLIAMSRLPRLRSPFADSCSDSITQSLERVSKVFGLRRPVTLLRSNRPGVVVTWGVLRPKVVVPADVSDWSPERIDVVLAHELAHVTRGDWLVQMIAEALKAVYWFNPLFWLICARLRHESECACDDAVMNIGVDSHAYATELLELARSFGRHRQQWLPAPAMVTRPSNLERRVRAMLNARVDRRALTRRGRWLSALALFALMLPIVSFAQGAFSTFSGVVVDQQDRLLPNTTITLNDSQRDVQHETKTDRNGRFELVGLPAGEYTYQTKLPGFRSQTGSVVINGQPVDRTLKLQVGLLEETVTVTSGDGALTSSQQSGQVFKKRPIPPCPTDVVNGTGGNIRPPHKVKDVRPGYPGVDGNIELAATIGTDGSVVDVQVIKSDRPELGPPAIDAVRQWEFDSTLLNCVPIEVQMNVSVAFRRGQ
jgi:beta-lactamase regulating signal transducer with metallopeptidase domain